MPDSHKITPDAGNLPDTQPDPDQSLAKDSRIGAQGDRPAQSGEPDPEALKRRDFPDGGGSGGAEAFRRRD